MVWHNERGEKIILRRIEAAVNFKNYRGNEYRIIHEGEKGGWIEKKANLSDNAWVGMNAKVYSDARVYGEAYVGGNAEVAGKARVHDRAIVIQNGKVSANAEICGNADIRGFACIGGNAIVSENAMVDNATVLGRVMVAGNAEVTNVKLDGTKTIRNKLDGNEKKAKMARAKNAYNPYYDKCLSYRSLI